MSEISGLVLEANSSGHPELAARAVAHGTYSSDELIRICALGSAVEFFQPEDLNLPDHIAWFIKNAHQSQTFELLSTLLARVWSNSYATLPPEPHIKPQPRSLTGLIAVHGTVLPLTQANRPEWSVPHTGDLFQHLNGIRPDIYDQSDYFRWEGGYTDYAREVAIQNITDWIGGRNLHGIDVVAHSHGCNVVMGSTYKGTSFRKMVLLNCPVHWNKYRPFPSAILDQIISVRIKFDFVILMDRGRQRFPSSMISEFILPLWYTGHSEATKSSTWQTENLDRHII